MRSLACVDGTCSRHVTFCRIVRIHKSLRCDARRSAKLAHRRTAVGDRVASETFAGRCTLTICVKHQRAVLAAFGLILLVTVVSFVKAPKGFLPEDDTGQLFVFTEAAQRARIA